MRKYALLVLFVLIFSIVPYPAAQAASGNDHNYPPGFDIDTLIPGEDYVENELLIPADSKNDADSVAKAYGAKVKTYSAHGYAVISLPKGKTAKSIFDAEKNRKGGSARKLYPNMIYKTTEYPYTPSDPEASRQYYHTDIGDIYAWDVTKGTADVVVAVIDTGIATQHSEFSGRISLKSINAATGATVTSDNYSAIEDDAGHGSHVSGIIAANQDNNAGGCGVAPGVTLMVIKANAPAIPGTFQTSTLINAIYYAVDNGARVINMSLGRSYDSGTNALEQKALQYAVDNGVLVVCAAGNDRDDHASYPAAYEQCVAVTALRFNHEFDYSYSNFGPEIDLAAPGTNIYSPNGAVSGHESYLIMSGTSMAAPMVSGAAALVLSQNPSLTLDQLKNKLYGSAVDKGAEGRDNYYGSGVVNTANALSETLYTVTFDPRGGSPVPSIKAAPDTTIIPPQTTRSGYLFSNWAHDPAGTEPWYNEPITHDTTLYAYWRAGEYLYEVSDNKVILSNYGGPGGDVVIPSKINGMPVTQIAPFAFYNRNNITSVTIPDSVESIGENAFARCYLLSQLTMGTGLKTIGQRAFEVDVALEHIILPDRLETIGDYAFSACDQLKSVTIGSKLREIGLRAFQYCESLTSLELPDSATSIGEYAFLNCSSLESFAFPSGLAEIPAHILEMCYSLKSIDIPDSVVTIGEGAFAGCAALTSVEIPDSVEEIVGAAFCGMNGLHMKLKSVTIGNSVKKIGGSTFSWCVDLETVKLGCSVQTVDIWAFLNCTSLTEISFPPSLESLGEEALAQCGNLSSVTFYGNAPVAGSGLFHSTSTDTVIRYISGNTGFAETWNNRQTETFRPEDPEPIRFFLNGTPGQAPVDQPVAYGTQATKPADPEWTGHTFEGWYLGPVCAGESWNFDDAVVWDIRLYAKWVPNEYSIKFSLNGADGVSPSAQNVAWGELVQKPSDPVRTGYRFEGWYREPECQNAWDFNAFTVTDSITLYAKWSIASLAVPASVKAVSASYNSVTVSWNAVVNAAGYEIWRSTASAGTYKIAGTAASTSFNDTLLATGTTYYYKVRAYRPSGSNAVNSNFSAIVSAKPVPVIPASVKTVQASFNSIRVTWGAVAGASMYEVYRSTSRTGTYTLLTSTTALGYTNANVSTGTTYYYKIRCYRLMGSVKVYSSDSTVVSAKAVLAVPGSMKATAVSYNNIRVSWGAAADATKYELYRSTSSAGTYSLIATTGYTYFTNTSLNTGTAYYYKVRTYRLVGNSKVYSGYTTVVSAKTSLTAPASVKAVRATATSIKITWGAVAGATKYEVWRSTSSSGTFVLIATTGSAYYTNTGLTTGRYYYYKVRAYRLVGSSKVYGGFTAIVYAKP